MREVIYNVTQGDRLLRPCMYFLEHPGTPAHALSCSESAVCPGTNLHAAALDDRYRGHATMWRSAQICIASVNYDTLAATVLRYRYPI